MRRSDVLKTSIYKFKKVIVRSVFVDVQLTQISLNFVDVQLTQISLNFVDVQLTQISLNFVDVQLTQISLNFQTFYCNLEIRDLEAKLCAAFLLFLFCKELWGFKVKEYMLLVEQKYKVYQNETDRKWKILHTVLEQRTMCFSSHKNCELKVKLRSSRKEKRMHFL